VVMVAAWNIQHYRSGFRPNTWQVWRSHEIISVLLFKPAQACKQLQKQMPTALNDSRITTTDRTRSISPKASHSSRTADTNPANLLMVLTCIRNALGSNPRQGNEHPESGFSVYSSYSPGKFQDSTSVMSLYHSSVIPALSAI